MYLHEHRRSYFVHHVLPTGNTVSSDTGVMPWPVEAESTTFRKVTVTHADCCWCTGQGCARWADLGKMRERRDLKCVLRLVPSPRQHLMWAGARLSLSPESKERKQKRQTAEGL